jgi:hypothetical protein
MIWHFDSIHCLFTNFTIDWKDMAYYPLALSKELSILAKTFFGT